MARREWTSREVETAVGWRLGGLKIAAIARRLNRSLGSVRQMFTRRRVVVESWRVARRKRGMLMRSVRELADVPAVEAATILGVDRSAVSRARKRLGLPTPDARSRALLAWRTRRMFAGVSG